jgi:hypothetical protein
LKGGGPAVGRATVQYPGGLAARYRWAGTGRGDDVFAMSEGSGRLVDHGDLGAADPSRACRAELRVEGPLGTWTARFASAVYDEPKGVLWDVPGLLVVKYGFRAYALDSRTGELRWSFASATPLVAVLASSRLDHVIVQTEVETNALDASGEVVWRVAHSDAVAEAELVGGRLVLTGWGGAVQSVDPRTGRPQA